MLQRTLRQQPEATQTEEVLQQTLHTYPLGTNVVSDGRHDTRVLRGRSTRIRWKLEANDASHAFTGNQRLQ